MIGSHGDREVNAQVQGTAGRLSYYLSGSFIENNLGIENPTGSRNAIHDHTDQGRPSACCPT